MLLGSIIGAASGVLQFWMLSKFTKAVTDGGFDKKAVMFGVIQFFLPLAVLLGCAFLLDGALLWAAAGMAAVLIVASFIKFLLARSSAGR